MLALLERAAADGHTVLPVAVLLAAASERDLTAAVESGAVVVHADLVALDELATAEEAVADELLGLAAEGRLAVVLGRVPDGAAAHVIADAHRRGLLELAAELQRVPEGHPVVLAGDPDALPGPQPGAVLLDLVGAGLVPVRDLRDDGGAGDLLARFTSAVRRGELPPPDPADRSVAAVPCPDAETVVVRARQLVTDSIPRTFGLVPADVLVLSPLARGVAGVDSLAAALRDTGATVSTVHGAAGRRAEAVVACFPGAAAGVLTRALVYESARTAGRHLSVVTSAGDDLAHAVARVPARRRRTSLPLRLAEG